MGEGHSCAPHRDAFAIPRDIDRLGWNAVKLRERVLDGFAVVVGFDSFPKSLHAVVDHDGDHDRGDGKRCHPRQDGADASKSTVDERANHHPISTGICAPSTSRFV